MKKLIFLILIKGFLMSANLDFITYKNKQIPLIYEKTSLPIFEMQLILKNSGYITDTQKKQGVTNLVAKMLNEGTLKDGAINFAKKLEQYAISIHAINGLETFMIETHCLIEHSKKAINYLNQLLKNPNITNKTLNKIRLIQLSKIEQKKVDYDYVASTNLRHIMFKNTPLSNINIGTSASIKEITLSDITNKINHLFNINNLIIVAGTNLEIEQFKKLILTVLDNFKDMPTKQISKIWPVDLTTNIEVIKDTKQAYIYFGSKFDIEPNSPDTYKAKVASFILGSGGFGSRLMEEIRVKEGLAYSAYGYIQNDKSNSYFKGYLQTKLQNKDKAIALVKQIINDFVTNGVTQKELQSAKKFLLGSEPLRNETLSQRLNRTFLLYYKGLDINYPQKELKLPVPANYQDVVC